MHAFHRLIVLAGIAAVAAVVPALGLGAAPVIRDHVNFTSDPVLDSICGIDATFVDSGVETYKQAADGSSMDNLMLTTLITAVDSGKSITFKSAELAKRSAPVANGDGTFTFTSTVYGLSPKIQIVGGQPIAVDTGNITFEITVDANGDFVSFDVVSIKGPRPVGGCDAIVAALT
jgi:hypothetical protein